MSEQSSVPLWLALAVVMVGISSLLLLGIEPSTSVAMSEVGTTELAAAATQPTPTLDSAQLTSTAFTLTLEAARATVIPPTPTSTATPLPPVVLPNAPEPEAGQLYLLRPQKPENVGWARAGDDKVNHFGDYNIYAGVFDGQPHIGAIQFDLSSIPPGSPILYADLTLIGLDQQWLATGGAWQVQLLHAWMDRDWAKRTFHWLAREDSGAIWLENPVPSEALAVGQSNTFFLPAAGLSQLEARLYSGKVAFRVVGPTSGENNLFAWDSGFGALTRGYPPLLRIITGGPAPLEPPPSPTPDYVVITLTPTDDAALVAMANLKLTATAAAPAVVLRGTPEPTVTATAFPPHWVTPVIVTNTPTPENGATAAWQAEVATAAAVVRGTATATPPNVWTATATPLPPPATATPLIVPIESLTPTSTPSITPEALPPLLRGKILFYSDRNGREDLMVMDADGSNVALWTGGAPKWIYERATEWEDYAPGGGRRVVVSSEQISNLQLWTLDLATGQRQQLTNFSAVAYDPVWSPVGNPIAFVSPEAGNDEIYVINADGSGLRQLTANEWEWDKHPSWSPDGTQLVFWSNRASANAPAAVKPDGTNLRQKQIWVMNADGTNPRNLSNNPYNDWDPVWVK